MAKNFVQDGTTIELVNAGDQTILSGAAVVVGSMVVVAITDIPAGETGDGFAEGVFLLPKQSADDIQSGAVVYLKDGVVQLAADGAVAAGVAWENAPANSATVAVFTRMCCRMDMATVRMMGKTAEINGISYDVIPEYESADMGALSGSQLSLVVFSAQYRPARDDVVVFEGRTLTVTRYDTYNGKPRIFVEQE